MVELVLDTIRLKAETQNVEIKSAHQGCPKKLYDTLSSFSNQDGGGIILFGIDEVSDFTITGVYDLQDLQKKVMMFVLQAGTSNQQIKQHLKFKMNFQKLPQ